MSPESKDRATEILLRWLAGDDAALAEWLDARSFPDQGVRRESEARLRAVREVRLFEDGEVIRLEETA